MQVQEEEFWLEASEGRLYAKTWRPTMSGSWTASPILLFHDSLGCVQLWRDFPQLLSLQTNRTIIAYDRIGFGRSAPAQAKLQSDFISDEAAEIVPIVLQQLGLTEFIACGHSVGGAMAIEAAGHFPRLCHGVITLGAQAFVTEQTVFGVQAAKADFEAPDEFKRLEKYHGERARWVLNAWTETWLGDEFKDWNLDEPLERIACPILAVHGDRDEYGPIDHAVRIAGDRGEISILPSIGHSPHRQDPLRLAEVIAKFIQSRDLP